VLKWCRENCKLPTGTDSGRSEVETDPVELAFTSELSEDIKNRLDNNYFLADALLFGFQPLIGETVEGVTVKKVVTGVGKKGKKDDSILRTKFEQVLGLKPSSCREQDLFF